MGSRYDISNLVEEIEKIESKEGPVEKKEEKSVYWKATLGEKEKRAEFIIRPLENLDSETNHPWVQRDAHMFPFQNKKFCYQPCPRMFDKNSGKKAGTWCKCPICEDKDALYATGDPFKEQIAQKRTPKKRYFGNFLIVKDPRDGGKNEGKVFIYEFGEQIFKKFTAFLANKEIPLAERCYFHPLKGTNFKLIITRKGEQLNYEDSDFSRSSSPMVINNKEATMEEAEAFIQENAYKLREKLLRPEVFKSYADIKEFYDNQGEVENKDNSEKKETKVADTTIKDQPVTARNPVQKVPEVKSVPADELPFDITPSADDEDAKLAKLLES